jgi:uncharacterized damage-inducible protein DinB
MSIADILLPEFDQEMANTRRALERVDESQLAWKPHERSMTLGRLASHVAELPGWAASVLAEDSYDIAPADRPAPYSPSNFSSHQEILDAFDASIATARKAIAATDDARMFQPWTLLRAGETVFTLPRAAVLRTMLFNHVVHHRGQLTVYLRLTGAKVPSIYGPSADEPRM